MKAYLIAERLRTVNDKLARIDKRRERSMLYGLFQPVTPEEQALVRSRTYLKGMAQAIGLERVA